MNKKSYPQQTPNTGKQPQVKIITEKASPLKAGEASIIHRKQAADTTNNTGPKNPK
jgi:hypothetical protein